MIAITHIINFPSIFTIIYHIFRILYKYIGTIIKFLLDRISHIFLIL